MKTIFSRKQKIYAILIGFIYLLVSVLITEQPIRAEITQIYEPQMGDIIALKSKANGMYVCAENGGASPLIANRSAIGTWEQFQVYTLPGNKIALKSLANNKYVCAENGGSSALIANRDAIGTWETFEVVVTNNNEIALKSLANNKYVCAEDGGASPLIANRDNIGGSWETFEVVIVSRTPDVVQVWLSNPNSNIWLMRQNDKSFSTSNGNADYTININENVRYQIMEGYGASLTDSSCWLMYYKLTDVKRKEVMEKLFSPNGINISILRQPIGSSDFAWEMWTYDDTPNNVDDWNLTYFSLWREDAYIRPILNQAFNVNPGRIKIFATPWSPPAWMKTGKSLIGNVGGILRPECYDVYANYLVKYLLEYKNRGTPIYAITVQNEPKYVPPYPGMLMSATEQINFINVLGPKIAQAGLNTKIICYDHNYDDINYATTVLSSNAANYVAGTGFHYYCALSHSNLTTLHNKFPNKDIWATECGSGTWIGGGTNKGMFLDLMMHTIRFPRNWAKSYIMWNIALDQNDGPKHPSVGTGNKGLLTIRSDITDNVTYNVQYYGLGHSSKFVHPGAYRIDSNTYEGAIETVAYRNTDGSKVLVLLNQLSTTKTVKIVWNSKYLIYTVPAESAITFKWY